MPGGNVVIIRVEKQGDQEVLKRLKELKVLAQELSKPINIKIETTTVERLSTVSKKAAEDLKVMAENAGKAGYSMGFNIRNAEGLVERLHGKLTVIEGDVKNVGNTSEEVFSQLKGAFSGLDSVLTSIENRVARGLVMKLRSATRDAIQMMKDVDDELVVVRKVSGATAEEVAAIGDRAYETATKYGVAASDYLSSVASFVRAGYRDQAEGLAELSVKTQLVGDVTEEVADQFLLSTDKAYKFGGSIEELNRVLDSANELDNKYATSISKIASGMGIVAPVAAQMNVSVEELMASIGTITAVTQRTGTEAARALRAIFLNIVGDTKTEIDEGVTWTTGEIAGLRDVLKKYVPDLVAEADLKGNIIDPMRAIEGLSKAMKEGLLTEQELMSMISDIGGKLRSSQLLALIQNWDMYSDMLKDIEGSAGSADREVQNALDSWTRKTEILRNTWTQFLTNFLNSDMVKKWLDALTNLVEWLDKNQWAVEALIKSFITLEAIHLFSRATNGAIAFAGQLKNIVGLIKTLFGYFGDFEATGLGTKLAGMVGEGGLLAEGSVLAMMGELMGIVGVVAGIAATAYKLDEKADQRRHNRTRAAIANREDTANAMNNEWVRGVEGIASTWRGQGLTSGFALTDAQADFSQYGGRLEEEVKSLQARYSAQGIQSYEDLKLYYERITKLKDEFEKQGIHDNMYEWLVGDIKEYAPIVEEYEMYLRSMQDVNFDVGTSFEELAEETEIPITSLNALSTALEKAKAKLQEYQAAQTRNEEKGTALSEYKGIYDTAMEHAANGEFGSTQFQSAMQLLLPREFLQEIEYDYEKAGEVAGSKYFQALMNATEDHGAAFANELYDLWEEGNDGIRDAIEIIQNADGSFTPIINDYEKLGEILHIDSEVLTAWSDQVDITNKGLNQTRDDILKAAEAAGALQTSQEGVVSIDLPKYFEGIINKGIDAGKSAQEIESDLYLAADALKDLDDIELTGAPEEIDKVRDAAKDTQLWLAEIEGDVATPEVDLDTSEFDRKMAQVEKKIETINGKTVTVHVGTSGGVHGGTGGKFAEGTDSAPGGNALTGEEGPELVLEGDSARIVGLGGPEITNLEPGAKVYTAEETDAILNRKGSRRIPTFWKGGTFTRASAATTASKSSGATRKSGASSSSAKSSAGKAKELTEEQKKQLEIHKAKVELLGTELDLLEAQNKPVKDQVAKIYEIQNALMDQINYMKSIGAEQADINKLYVQWYKWQDEIAKLQKEIYKDLDDAIDNELKEIKEFYDEQKDAIDSQIDALKEAKDAKEDELDLEKKLLAVEEARANLANAQTERTVRMYNAATGQWEWVADAKKVQSAQEALDKAEEDLAKFYEDAAYDAQVAALEAMKDALEDEYEAIKDQWQEILDALEEPAKSLEEVLQDIANNATSDMQDEIDALNEMLAKFGYMIPLKGGSPVITTSASKLSPSVTSALYAPVSQTNASIAQSQVASTLKYLQGSTGTYDTLGGSKIGSQTNTYGDVYTMNGVTITEAQAKSMTVYELAQMSRNLQLYNNVN